MNSITITGRLTTDPVNRTHGETQICDMRIAIPRRRGNDGSDRGAVFIDVTVFNGLAATCARYLGKGRRVAVVGRLELDEWQAEDKTPRRRHKIVADTVEFLDGPPAGSNGNTPPAAEQPHDELAERRGYTPPTAHPVPA